jgi:hypothetical protein
MSGNLRSLAKQMDTLEKQVWDFAKDVDPRNFDWYTAGDLAVSFVETGIHELVSHGNKLLLWQKQIDDALKRSDAGLEKIKSKRVRLATKRIIDAHFKVQEHAQFLPSIIGLQQIIKTLGKSGKATWTSNKAWRDWRSGIALAENISGKPFPTDMVNFLYSVGVPPALHKVDLPKAKNLLEYCLQVLKNSGYAIK